jgi:hypothetical protein
MISEEYVPPSMVINDLLYRGCSLQPTLLAHAVRQLYPITRQRFIWTRYEFPFILNAMGLVGEGAEVGIFRGSYSTYCLTHWKGRLLHSIDPWRYFPGGEYTDITNSEDEAQQQLYEGVRRRLARFGDRSRIVRDASPQAAANFRDGQLDYVFIDAQHHYEAVRADLRGWFGKVRRGGILAGHDYLDGVLPEGIFGVKRAVDEFAAETGLAVHVSREKQWKSYFILKD